MQVNLSTPVPSASGFTETSNSDSLSEGREISYLSGHDTDQEKSSSSLFPSYQAGASSQEKNLRKAFSAKIKPSLHIDIQPEKFIRFNELMNALQALPELPAELLEKLEGSDTPENNMASPFASLIHSYARGCPVTGYPIGEALSHLTTGGQLSLSDDDARSGIISKTLLEQARKKDPALNVLMNHLLTAAGDI